MRRRTNSCARHCVLGTDHPETLISMGELAETLDDMHHYPEAEALYREALAVQLRVLGPDHPGIALTRYNLACNLALTGHRDESLALLRESVDHGFNPVYAANMEHDSDLNSLHGDPRFTELIAYVHQRIAAAQKQK
jgi:hypothetical protein